MGVIASTVHCMPLTSYLFLGMLPDATHQESLVYTCAALRQGIQKLVQHYRTAFGASQQEAIPLLTNNRWVAQRLLSGS